MSEYKSRRRIVADNEPDDLDDVLPEEAQDDEGTPSEDIESDDDEEDDALDRVLKAKAAIASDAALAERSRVLGLIGLVKHAARLGVDIDLRNAVESGISMKQARVEVLNTAAEQSENRPISTGVRYAERDFSPRPPSGAKAKTIWKNAFKRD